MARPGGSRFDATLPEVRGASALFLDLDGTLLDLAPTPDSVVVPPDAVPILRAVQSGLEGAVAVVSGRPLCHVDRLLAPLRLPAGAEHGAVVRTSAGVVEAAGLGRSVPQRWVDALVASVRGWHGIMVERKAYSVVIHFRQAPERDRDALAAATAVCAENPQDFVVMPAKLAYEIRSRFVSKAVAVRRLMRDPPFAGRIPIYVGDDVTDEDGIRAAQEFGGVGVRVDSAFAGRPAEVRAWLRHVADRLTS